jgi:dolichyl-phosphate-mannose--protein O-mannosyl transferase
MVGYLFVRWIRTRDWRQPEGFILLGFAATYLAWLVLAPARPAVFLFYILPALPFMFLAVAYVVGVITTGVARKIAVVAVGILSVGWFFLYYPIIGNVPISFDRWDAQMFFQDCHVPPHRELETHTVTQAINRETTIIKTRIRTEDKTKDFPPTGWCWN